MMDRKDDSDPFLSSEFNPSSTSTISKLLGLIVCRPCIKVCKKDEKSILDDQLNRGLWNVKFNDPMLSFSFPDSPKQETMDSTPPEPSTAIKKP